MHNKGIDFKVLFLRLRGFFFLVLALVCVVLAACADGAVVVVVAAVGAVAVVHVSQFEVVDFDMLTVLEKHEFSQFVPYVFILKFMLQLYGNFFSST